MWKLLKELGVARIHRKREERSRDHHIKNEKAVDHKKSEEEADREAVIVGLKIDIRVVVDLLVRVEDDHVPTHLTIRNPKRTQTQQINSNIQKTIRSQPFI